MASLKSYRRLPKLKRQNKQTNELGKKPKKKKPKIKSPATKTSPEQIKSPATKTSPAQMTSWSKN